MCELNYCCKRSCPRTHILFMAMLFYYASSRSVPVLNEDTNDLYWALCRVARLEIIVH